MPRSIISAQTFVCFAVKQAASHHADRLGQRRIRQRAGRSAPPMAVSRVVASGGDKRRSGQHARPGRPPPGHTVYAAHRRTHHALIVLNFRQAKVHGPANSPPEAGRNRHLRPVNSPVLAEGTEPLGEAEAPLTNNFIW